MSEAPQKLLKWTIEAVRNDETMMSWLEERKYEWVPLVKNAVSRLMEGSAIIIITDPEREWFGKYVLQSVNKSSKGRPYLPIYSIESLFPNYRAIRTDEELELINDMLGISFRQNYIYWYVGKFDDSCSQIALRKDDSFLWVMDQEYQNSFPLSSIDDLLDMRLLQLFRIFDKTVSSALFNEVLLEE